MIARSPVHRRAGLVMGLSCLLLTVGAAENVIRLLPPLIIDEQQVDEAVQAIERVCSGWAKAA